MMAREMAKTCHETHRAYCQALGDDSMPSWDDARDHERNDAIECVYMYLEKYEATPESEHERWLANAKAHGWIHGKVFDSKAKTHPCCLPYGALAPAQRVKYYLFRAVVRSLADVL